MGRGGIRILNVVGARPNFMKMAPLMAAYRGTDAIEPLLVHTGQHYDEAMSKLSRPQAKSTVAISKRVKLLSLRACLSSSPRRIMVAFVNWIGKTSCEFIVVFWWFVTEL